ncbi:MAG: phosphoglucosamine mutase [Elusimicrobiaceae bacterium]|nr:phosphoglucosamine mutase [Elusimicrobiaceae bacterium]
MTKYFGTDGVRAVAGEFPLVDDFVEKLGYCALKELLASAESKGLKNQVIIARDTRLSGPSILQSLSKGIRAAGANVLDMGISPTPSVAEAVKQTGSVCGIVISASHNPPEFNGIKFFSNKGTKLAEDLEERIETLLEKTTEIPSPTGSYRCAAELVEGYKNFLKATVDASLLKGTKVVLDCANGAAYKIAPEVFESLGMQVVVMADKNNGAEINEGVGALHTSKMRTLVKKEKAYIGFSFDGDADRVIASDEEGRQLDGEYIIAAAALALKEQGKLPKNKAVMTVMANLGCINYLKDNGVDMVLTPVGDKYVSQALEKEGLSIGGETSGHIIFPTYSNTGDGILSALQFLKLAKKSGLSVSEFALRWKKYPCELRAVMVKEKKPLEDLPHFLEGIKQLEGRLGKKGRLFVRYSGTEPKLRILVEGEDETLVHQIAEEAETLYRCKMEEK